jgi:membrane fusion protein, multidrug efflux system
MANPKGTNPANSRDGKPRAVEASVHRLDRSPLIANEQPGTAEAEMPRPEHRKPEALPPGEPHGRQVATNAPAPKKSMRRPLMFALLPVALVVGGYFYVTGGAVMSTDNAYVQADMVGLSSDVAGIVTQVLVHDNQKVAKGDILFKLDPLQFQLALDRAEALSFIGTSPMYNPPSFRGQVSPTWSHGSCVWFVRSFSA